MVRQLLKKNLENKMFKNLVDQTIIGIQTGSIYALLALGYTMVYGIVKFNKFCTW